MKTLLAALLIYLTAVNITAFILYGRDKKKAERHEWRTRESTLLLSAFLGGGIGSLLGMQVFHHKTKKWKFRILVPLAVLLWILLLWYLVYQPAG